MLSALGRRLYFPKGILSQSAEAGARAKRMNATIGIATEGGEPMYLRSLASHFRDLSPAEAFNYAPPAGQPALRERWREKALAENPSLRGKVFGLPIVTSAITHGLALVGDLFVDPGDRIVLPDKQWDNYALTFQTRLGAELVTHPFYAGGGYAVDAFREALATASAGREKVLALLNFPNNPTGYVPTPSEGESIVRSLVAQAERGTKVVAVLDDAYFGLFYHVGGASMTESLFGPLTNRHPNLMAIRLDGATKELFVWGLRCGFMTFGPGRAETAKEVAEVLDAKARGAIRSGISNVPAALPVAGRQGPRLLVALRRAQAEARAAARARRARPRGRERPSLPRELGGLPLQQRLLHVRASPGRRGGAGAPAPARPLRDRRDRGRRLGPPHRLLLSGAGPDRASVRDAASGDPGAAERVGVGPSRAQKGYVNPSSAGSRSPISRQSVRQKACKPVHLGVVLARLSAGGIPRRRQRTRRCGPADDLYWGEVRGVCREAES